MATDCEFAMYGYDDTAPGIVTFALATGGPVSIRGIVLEFY